MNLVAYTLIVNKDTVFYQIPLPRFYSFIVKADSAERTWLKLISYKVHHLVTVLEGF
jgi:hypothetical protein